MLLGGYKSTYEASDIIRGFLSDYSSMDKEGCIHEYRLQRGFCGPIDDVYSCGTGNQNEGGT